MKNTIVALCLLLAAALLYSCGGGAEKLSAIPEDLTGIWETSEKKYAGCQLEIKAGSMRFHGVGGVANDYYVLEVEAAGPERDGGFESAVGVQRRKGNLYIVHCRDTLDEEWDFHLVHTPGKRESLKFKNRTGSWHRE